MKERRAVEEVRGKVSWGGGRTRQKQGTGKGGGQKREGEKGGVADVFQNLQNVCLTCAKEWPRNVFHPELSKVTTPTAKRKMECLFFSERTNHFYLSIS